MEKIKLQDLNYVAQFVQLYLYSCYAYFNCAASDLPSLGNDNYCTWVQCDLGEGDCDDDDECSGELICGTDNCEGMEYDNGDDCCGKILTLYGKCCSEKYNLTVQEKISTLS